MQLKISNYKAHTQEVIQIKDFLESAIKTFAEEIKKVKYQIQVDLVKY